MKNIICFLFCLIIYINRILKFDYRSCCSLFYFLVCIYLNYHFNIFNYNKGFSQGLYNYHNAINFHFISIILAYFHCSKEVFSFFHFFRKGLSYFHFVIIIVYPVLLNIFYFIEWNIDLIIFILIIIFIKRLIIIIDSYKTILITDIVFIDYNNFIKESYTIQYQFNFRY